MSNRVLVTGATGFVGRQVMKYLSLRDTRLTVVVRKGKQDLLFCQKNIEKIIQTDDLFAETEDWWADELTGIDTVIHLAWYAEPGSYLQSIKNIDCLKGTLAMSSAAKNAGVRRFIGAGTCFEYDLSAGYLSVDTLLKPLTPYAASKAAAYYMLSQFFSTQAIEFAWCRLFYLYGEGEDSRRLVPYLRRKLGAGEVAELTSGNQIRDFIDVSEAGKEIAEVALGNVCGPINVCSGIPVTVRDLAESIADEYQRRDLLKFGTRPDNLFDPPCVVGIRN
ncbi:oxidoreductase [Pseudohongiella acticola]|uniref:Oxidoreductase n=1 Tax=Pseudohongiella acticola TaxID=1524254 RepID=A0A1E8CH80_9GAMM|nr:NAD(P)-dependent oxidoreductase [Pseudohongiella acticola]OFE11752.1 oxidoreductase [Pseudohongiella acticola]